MDPAPADPAATSSSRPSTHPEAPPCPSWCVRDHADQDPDEWIYIGDGRHGLDLSIESVRRLVWVLGRVVGQG